MAALINCNFEKVRESMVKVLNFGSLNIDYVYRVDHILVRGETLLSEDRKVYAGGKGLNQSVALGRAGLDVWHAGNVGEEGRFLLDILQDAHVNTDFVRVLKDIPCGHTVIQNDRDGDNCILLFGGANQCVTGEQIEDVLGHFQAGDVLVLQNEVNRLDEIMNLAHERGMKIVLNPSPINQQIFMLPLQYVDYLFVNEIEAGLLTDTKSRDASELVPALHKRFGDTNVILTLGGEGSWYISGDMSIHQDIFKVHAVDTTAAGDTFSGYFITGILQGKKPEEALSLASKAAAIAVSRRGAAPSIPTMEEVMQFSY
ncbi:MAG: ribokinase [Eubacterium sp.]|nr:ribokinase [Eubacterium sp.]